MTIQDLFERAGGAIKIATAVNLHQHSVERWQRSGIPRKYWAQLQMLYKLKDRDIEKINQRIKR